MYGGVHTTASPWRAYGWVLVPFTTKGKSFRSHRTVAGLHQTDEEVVAHIPMIAIRSLDHLKGAILYCPSTAGGAVGSFWEHHGVWLRSLSPPPHRMTLWLSAIWGPKDHINIRILYLVLRPKKRGIPKTMVRRIWAPCGRKSPSPSPAAERRIRCGGSRDLCEGGRKWDGRIPQSYLEAHGA